MLRQLWVDAAGCIAPISLHLLNEFRAERKERGPLGIVNGASTPRAGPLGEDYDAREERADRAAIRACGASAAIRACVASRGVGSVDVPPTHEHAHPLDEEQAAREERAAYVVQAHAAHRALSRDDEREDEEHQHAYVRPGYPFKSARPPRRAQAWA
mmetsp:Transcript_47151/g.108554  ORF Transcript_47151/g.108554 Transcript_47151/m.108554 type:complete len:157 (-) Transcript_47151:45-515(-)